jgi:hypothetical protein
VKEKDNLSFTSKEREVKAAKRQAKDMEEVSNNVKSKAVLSIVFLILFCAALWIIIFIFSGSYELASAITNLFFVSICKFVKQIHDLFFTTCGYI